jgi:single-stranded DNA-binding protein
MSNVNKAILVGRVGNINSGSYNQGQESKSYMNLTIATNERVAVREPNTGNVIRWDDKTTWHKASAFGGIIERINRSGITKGSLVRIEGRMDKSENKVTQDGVVYVYHDTTIMIESVFNLTPKNTAE